MKNILVAMVREPCLMLNYSLKWDEGQGENLPKTRYGNSSPTPTPHTIPKNTQNKIKLKNSLKWDEGQGENLPKTRYGNSSPTPTPHIIPTVSDYEVRTE